MIARLWRSTFGLVILVALGFAAITPLIGFMAGRVTHEALEKQLDHRIEAETAALLAEAREGGLAGLARAIGRRESARAAGSLDYLLIDARGQPIAGDMRTVMPMKAGYEEFFAYQRGARSGIAQAITTPVAGGMLVVAVDRAGVGEIDRTLGRLFAVMLAVMLVVGIGAAALIGIVTRRRLARIDATAQAIIGGDFDRRVPRDGSGSEFDNLATTLNTMLDRISGLIENLRQVSSDVAHDLRTPLTRLHNRLDAALTAEPARQHEAIEAARAEVVELLEIFAALLRIAEIEGMAERLPRTDVDLSALLEQMAETYRPDIESSGRHLVLAIESGLHMPGDRRLLAQAIANLLDNALRHTPPDTTIRLSVGSHGAQLRLQVADNGPGIGPNIDSTRLFQRFTRSEQARSSAGHGLGLALVSAVTIAHGGSAVIEPGLGFCVALSFPGN